MSLFFCFLGDWGVHVGEDFVLETEHGLQNVVAGSYGHILEGDVHFVVRKGRVPLLDVVVKT